MTPPPPVGKASRTGDRNIRGLGRPDRNVCNILRHCWAILLKQAQRTHAKMPLWRHPHCSSCSYFSIPTLRIFWISCDVYIFCLLTSLSSGFLATRVLPGAIGHSILRTSVKPRCIPLSNSQDPELVLLGSHLNCPSGIDPGYFDISTLKNQIP